jgi:hypothetical protein
MKVAVAVPRIKGLYRNRDQEIALSGVANALASRCMAHTLGLVQGVRHVVRYSALFQDPLAIRPAKRRQRQKEKG